MPIDTAKVAIAMASGLSAFCSTCRRYWEARDAGIPGDKCTSTTGCGSPLAGDDFHDYDGPLNGAPHKFCFVCGDKSRYGLRVGSRPRVIGACEKHIHYVQKLQAVGAPEMHVNAKDANGVAFSSERPVKPNLMQAIQEVEDHYAKKG